MRFQLAALLLIVCSACAVAADQSAPAGTHLTTAAREVHEGQIVDGVPCLREELAAHHVHVHVGVFLDGSPITVPAGIGVGRPWVSAADGFILQASCFAWIHTHDTSGVVHVFTQIGKSYTLGQLFSVWGQPLSDSGALGFHGPIVALVNGQPKTDNLRSLPLENLENIVLELGIPPSPPPGALYDFGTMRR